MEFNDSVIVGAPRERVWQTLSDPQEIGPCIPGLQAVEIYDEGRAFGGQASIKVGSTALTFPARVAWVEQNGPHGGSLQATAVLAGYNIEGRGAVTLKEAEGGETALVWHAAVDIPERLADNPLMLQMARMFATRFFQGFFQCIRSRLETV